MYQAKSVNDVPTVGRRKGFPLRLHGDHWRAIHLAYTWMKAKGENPPDIDELMASVVPPFDELSEKLRTTRLRAKDIRPMAYLLAYAALLPFKGNYTLAGRARTLEKIDPNELLADAVRE